MDACSRPESIDRGDGPLPAGDHRRPAVAAGVRSCLAFFLGDTEMALPLTDVRETGQLAAVAPLPNLPGWIRGILHRRGEILSAVDLACFLGLPASQWTGPGQPYLLFRQSDLACCLEVARAGVVVHPEDRECAAPEARPSTPARLTAQISGVFRLRRPLVTDWRTGSGTVSRYASATGTSTFRSMLSFSAKISRLMSS